MKKIIYRRILALIIDSMIISVIFSVISPLFIKNFYLGSFTFFEKTWVISFHIYFIVFLCYFLFFDLLNNGITFGKMILHVRLVSEKNDSLPAKGTQFIRSLVKAIATTIPLISIIYYAIKKRTIQDVVAKTKTIYL